MSAILRGFTASCRGINGRIFLVAIVAMAALAAVGLVSVRTITSVTLAEHEARARVIVEAATKIIESFEAKAAKGELTQDAAQAATKDVLRTVRYDGAEYISIKLADGMTVMHGQVAAREGTNTWNDQDSNGTYFAREMTRSAQEGGGLSYYPWAQVPNTPPVRKATYSKFAAGDWKWLVSSGIYLDDVDAAVWNNALRTAGTIAVLALVTFGLAFWLGRRITRPILGLSVAANRLAEGDLSI